MHPLVKLAKDTLRSLFAQEEPEMPEGYEDEQGCFVTLTKDGELRGCIGYVTNDKPLKRSVKDAAEAAARNDPRFPPVREEELEGITVEVSVLSKPRRVQTDEPVKRLQAFNPGETGLIIQRGWKSGLLLPQVFDEDTPAEEAMRMTCRKAGLPPDAWKQPETGVYTFTATIHKENAKV